MELYDYYQDVADMGRGGVRMPDPMQGKAMFYNPAMLAFVKGFRWTILDIQAGANSEQKYNQITSNPPSQSNISQYYGENFWIGASGQTAVTMPNFGFGAYSSNYVDAMATNPAYPAINVEGIEDLGYVLGFAVNITPNLAFGINAKRITRTGGTSSIGVSAISGSVSVSTIQNSLSASGTGYGADAGLVWRDEGAITKTVSLNYIDVGDTSFIPSSGTNTPPVLENNLTLGVTLQQNVLGFGWGAGVEYRHILNYDVDISKKIDMGLDVELGIIDVRGGFYQGYATYGASVDLFFLTFDAAEYTVERGLYAGQNPDPRIQVGFRFEAGFDPDFSITDVGGKKRKLKQRR